MRINSHKVKILGSIVCSIGLVVIRARSVYAVNALVKARTIGELIVTILAGAGTAVTNPQVIPQIYQAYDLPEYSIEEMIDNGILSIEGKTKEEAIEALGTRATYDLDYEQFRELIETNWSVIKDNNLDTAFRLWDLGNTDPTYGAMDNIGQIARNVAENGALIAENNIALVNNPGQFVLVGIDVITDAVKSVFSRNIKLGLPINTILPNMDIDCYNAVANEYNMNMRFYTYVTGSNENVYYASYGIPGTICPNGVYALNNNTGSITVQRYNGMSLNLTPSDRTWSGKDIPLVVGGAGYLIGCSNPCFDTAREAQDYLNNIKNGGNPIKVTSPDIINQEYGNVESDDELSPYIQNGEELQIIPSEDYNDFMDDISENTTPQENADTMMIFINNYIQETPQITPSIVPQQPTLTPKPPVTDEDINTSLGGVTEGLEDIFPFCIPFDIKRIFEKLEVTRRAPHIEYTIEYHGNDLGTIDVDLSSYDTIATLVRDLEVILFILGLAMITRQIIGA